MNQITAGIQPIIISFSTVQMLSYLPKIPPVFGICLCDQNLNIWFKHMSESYDRRSDMIKHPGFSQVQRNQICAQHFVFLLYNRLSYKCDNRVILNGQKACRTSNPFLQIICQKIPLFLSPIFSILYTTKVTET